jgi:hypothetical protein
MTSSSGRIGSGRILYYIASVLGMHNIHNCKIRASGEVRAKMAMKRCWLNACGRPASRIQNSEYKRSERYSHVVHCFSPAWNFTTDFYEA